MYILPSLTSFVVSNIIRESKWKNKEIGWI